MFFPLWLLGSMGSTGTRQCKGQVFHSAWTGEWAKTSKDSFCLGKSFCIDEFDLRLQLDLNLTLLYPLLSHGVHISKVTVPGEC